MTKPKWTHLYKRKYRFISWGCGLQSTTLAVMAALGDLPPVDAVIHADLGFERRETEVIRDFYVDWLQRKGVKVAILHVGDISQLGAENHIHIPFWTETGGPLKRQCTVNFKIKPIRRFAREFAGFPASKPPQPKAGQFTMLLGITLDEWERMADSRVEYIVNSYPFVDMGWRRADCEDYLRAKGLPVPVKSACVICPYRSPAEWLEIRKREPDRWRRAVEFDNRNRNNPLAVRGKSTADQLFVYKKLLPLESADLEADAGDREPGGCVGPYCWN